MSESRYRPDRFVPRRVQRGPAGRDEDALPERDGGRRPRWRRHLVGAGLGWLVVMTIWGFGRAADPAAAGRYLLAGLVAGAAAWVVTARR